VFLAYKSYGNLKITYSSWRRRFSCSQTCTPIQYEVKIQLIILYPYDIINTLTRGPSKLYHGQYIVWLTWPCICTCNYIICRQGLYPSPPNTNQISSLPSLSPKIIDAGQKKELIAYLLSLKRRRNQKRINHDEARQRLKDEKNVDIREGSLVLNGWWASG